MTTIITQTFDVSNNLTSNFNQSSPGTSSFTSHTATADLNSSPGTQLSVDSGLN